MDDRFLSFNLHWSLRTHTSHLPGGILPVPCLLVCSSVVTCNIHQMGPHNFPFVSVVLSCRTLGCPRKEKIITDTNTFIMYLFHLLNYFHYYWPQRSWAKVMFLQASVILLTGEGVCLRACWDTPQEQTPPGADTPPQSTPWSRHTPRKQTLAYGQ